MGVRGGVSYDEAIRRQSHHLLHLHRQEIYVGLLLVSAASYDRFSGRLGFTPRVSERPGFTNFCSLVQIQAIC